MKCYTVEYKTTNKIKADNEEQARQILVDQGGFEIQGTLRYVDNAYADATLTEVEE